MYESVDRNETSSSWSTGILEFWRESRVFERLVRKNAGKNWSFIDGPITANLMGVHHAWGRAYKDVVQRFKAMLGYDQRFQNGFDCQGLWRSRRRRSSASTPSGISRATVWTTSPGPAVLE